MTASADRDARSRWLGAALLVLVMVLAVAVRALGLEYVFVDGEIVFPPADAQYHLRRALYTFAEFPRALLFDPYINHPGGASVPWPPLFDWTLGAVGRVLGDTERDLELVAAWSGPAAAAIAVGAIHLCGVRLGSRRVGIVAGLFFALLPISAVYTRVGNADHHAAIGMIGAWLLYACLALADPAASRSRMVSLGALLFVVRTTMLLTWHGSLLYLLPADALLLAVAVRDGRRSLPAVQAVGALASAAVVALVLDASPPPLGGAYSSIALSRLHLVTLIGVAVVSGGLLAATAAGLGATPLRRLLSAAAVAVVFAGALALVGDVREGLWLALRFLTLDDEVGAITGEQSPLFGLGPFSDRAPGRPAVLTWGLFGYALPLAAAAGALAGRFTRPSAGARAAGLVLIGWGLLFGSLAVLQRRYGNDAAPAASLLFALALVALADQVLRRLPAPEPGAGRRLAAGGLAALLVVVGFAPALARVYVPRARATLAAGPRVSPAVASSVAPTLHRFAGAVRAATPETAGYLDPDGRPDYGIAAHPNLGHALQYRARRATATDPFWWYIGRENWDRTLALLAEPDEQAALALAEALDARFVVTSADAAAGSVFAHLHDQDGRALTGREPLRHFRLVTEAEPGGASMGALFRPGAGGDRRVPYKLFEIVEGAVLDVPAEPGAPVVVAVTVRAPTGREFNYQAVARAGDDGHARVRVPYATKPDPDPADDVERAIARALGPYRVRAGTTIRAVHVPEKAVREGETVSMHAGLGAPMPDASVLRRPRVTIQPLPPAPSPAPSP